MFGKNTKASKRVQITIEITGNTGGLKVLMRRCDNI